MTPSHDVVIINKSGQELVSAESDEKSPGSKQQVMDKLLNKIKKQQQPNEPLESNVVNVDLVKTAEPTETATAKPDSEGKSHPMPTVAEISAMISSVKDHMDKNFVNQRASMGYPPPKQTTKLMPRIQRPPPSLLHTPLPMPTFQPTLPYSLPQNIPMPKPVPSFHHHPTDVPLPDISRPRTV